MIIIAFKWHCIKCSSLVKGEYHKPIKEYVVVVVVSVFFFFGGRLMGLNVNELKLDTFNMGNSHLLCFVWGCQ